MTETWMLAGLWLALALLAAVFSVWFRVATALSEIVVGASAQLVLGYLFGASTLGADQLLRAGSRSYQPFFQGSPGELHHPHAVRSFIPSTESSSQLEITRPLILGVTQMAKILSFITRLHKLLFT